MPSAQVKAAVSATVLKAAINIKPKATDAIRTNPKVKIKDGLKPKRAKPGKLNSAQRASQSIERKYKKLGGLKSWLKKSTTPVTICPDKKGYFRHYQGGSIYFHPKTGAQSVKGAIRALWANQGWERGSLGYPKTDEEVGRNKDGRGRYSHFQGGSIYWTKEHGAIIVEGAILLKYLDTGAESGILGYPKREQTVTPDKKGRFIHFERGSIYDSNTAGAWEVHGLIRGYWASKGWERNENLGYPISDERIPRHNSGSILAVAANTVHLFSPQMMMAAQPLPVSSLKINKTAIGLTTLPKIAIEKNPILLDAKTAKAASKIAKVKPKQVKPSSTVTLNNAYQESENRFSDFQNGVVFWKRGSSSARELSPWLRTKSKVSMRRSPTAVAKEVKSIVSAKLKTSALSVVGCQFVSTSSYTHDESGVHNRRHKFEVKIKCQERNANKWVQRILKLRVDALVSWDSLSREVQICITKHAWISFSNRVRGISDLHEFVNLRLHPIYWKPHTLFKIPSKDNNQAVCVLSVKTMKGGSVNTYIEPAN